MAQILYYVLNKAEHLKYILNLETNLTTFFYIQKYDPSTKNQMASLNGFYLQIHEDNLVPWKLGSQKQNHTVLTLEIVNDVWKIILYLYFLKTN